MKFTKYHGNGNDFILFDSCDLDWLITNANYICHRQMGIGADGIILLSGFDKIYVINADGSIADNCGNGLRCAALHIFDKLGLNKVEIKLGGRVFLCQKQRKNILVNMGLCSVNKPENFLLPNLEKITYSQVDIGNKHLVLYLKNQPKNLNLIIGSICDKFSDQKFNFNIGLVFIDPRDNRHIISKVFERGVGWTNSCGSGACAAAAMVSHLGNYKQESKKLNLKVSQPGGDIIVSLAAFGGKKLFQVSQAGPAKRVFVGKL